MLAQSAYPLHPRYLQVSTDNTELSPAGRMDALPRRLTLQVGGKTPVPLSPHHLLALFSPSCFIFFPVHFVVNHVHSENPTITPELLERAGAFETDQGVRSPVVSAQSGWPTPFWGIFSFCVRGYPSCLSQDPGAFPVAACSKACRALA